MSDIILNISFSRHHGLYSVMVSTLDFEVSWSHDFTILKIPVRSRVRPSQPFIFLLLFFAFFSWISVFLSIRLFVLFCLSASASSSISVSVCFFFYFRLPPSLRVVNFVVDTSAQTSFFNFGDIWNGRPRCSLTLPLMHPHLFIRKEKRRKNYYSIHYITYSTALTRVLTPY